MPAKTNRRIPKKSFSLLCWILDGSCAFSVNIGTSNTVYDLKVAIKKVNQNRLSGIDASGLSLWKLNLSRQLFDAELLEPEKTFGERIKSRGDLETFAQQLSTSADMLAVFPKNPPKGHVQILVQHSSTTFSVSRKRAGSPTAENVKRMRLDPALPTGFFVPNLSNLFTTDRATICSFISIPNLAELSNNEPATIPSIFSLVPNLFQTDPTDAWLVELHSKIWNRHEDLSSKLYHKVNVTVDQYHELQNRLKELHPDRDSPAYYSKDVLSTKLEFLRSYRSAPSGAHSRILVKNDKDSKEREDSDQCEKADECKDVEEYEDSAESENSEETDDNDKELGSIFPAALEFLDLSCLELQRVPPRLPLPLFIRKEYTYISTLIRNLPPKQLVIVSGQPGTGTTAFLYLGIINSMLNGHQFLYQTIRGTVYHVSQTIKQIKSWPALKGQSIVAFVDADSGTGMPQPFLYMNPAVQIIAASSPAGAAPEQPWLKPGNNIGVVNKYAATLWSPSEFFLTGIFLHPHDLTFTRLKASAARFGFNPRNCFDASKSADDLHQLTARTEAKINSSQHDIRTLWNETLTSEGLSHSIFEFSPSDANRLLCDARKRPVSSWVLDVLLEKYEKDQADAAAKFYFSMVCTPDAETLRRHLLERKVLNYIDNFNGSRNFSMRSLVNSATSTWTYSGPIERVNFESSPSSQSFTLALESAFEEQKPLHLVLLDPNFGGINSIFYDPAEGLTCIQITIRNRHKIAVSGLRRIRKWLEPGTSLESLRPSRKNPWRIIFLVPEDVAHTFQQQDIKGDANKYWDKQVDQYVLGINEGVVWGRAT